MTVRSKGTESGAGSKQIHYKKLKLAMALSGANRHYRVAEIQRRHFDETARECGLGSAMNGIIEDVLSRTPAVIEKVGANLPKRYPEHVFDAIARGLRSSAKQLAP